MRPDTIPARFEVLDERFASCRGDSRFERLYDGCRWAEGPVYVPAGRYVVWSDIPNERMLRWDEMTGNVGLFRSPSGFSNGNTLDREGRFALHGTFALRRLEMTQDNRRRALEVFATERIMDVGWREFGAFRVGDIVDDFADLPMHQFWQAVAKLMFEHIGDAAFSRL